MIPLEAFGWFMIGVGSTLIVIGLMVLIQILVRTMRHRNKFKDYVQSLKNYSAELRKHSEELKKFSEVTKNSTKEISELTFRDKDGELCTVKIVVDHNIQLTDEDKELMRQMISRGDAETGSLGDILTNASYEESEMKKVQQFVFSGHAAEQMRAQGLELDEVVRKMLKASGRIA